MYRKAVNCDSHSDVFSPSFSFFYPFTDSNLRKTANTKAFDSFTNSVKETDAVKNVTITTQLEGLFYNKINLFEFTSHFL